MFSRALMMRRIKCFGDTLRFPSNMARIPPQTVANFSSSAARFDSVASQTDLSADSLLRSIVDAYAAEKGQTFFLPLGNNPAMRQLRGPFERLLAMGEAKFNIKIVRTNPILGIKSEFLADACKQCEELFKALTTNGTNALKIIELFVEYLSMSYEDAIRFYAK